MTARPTSTDDSDLSLPPVHLKTIQSLEREGADTNTLYHRVLQDDAATALFIRRRAINLAPESLKDREEIAKLALQAVELKNKQVLINGLNSRLTGKKHAKQAIKSAKTDLSLPPSL